MPKQGSYKCVWEFLPVCVFGFVYPNSEGPYLLWMGRGPGPNTAFPWGPGEDMYVKWWTAADMHPENMKELMFD